MTATRRHLTIAALVVAILILVGSMLIAAVAVNRGDDGPHRVRIEMGTDGRWDGNERVRPPGMGNGSDGSMPSLPRGGQVPDQDGGYGESDPHEGLTGPRIERRYGGSEPAPSASTPAGPTTPDTPSTPAPEATPTPDDGSGTP